MTRASALPEPSLASYTEAQIRFAASAWPLRAAEELRSARIFHALKCAARASNIEPVWVRRFQSAVGDELRHTKLCVEVGARLGAQPPQHDSAPVRSRLRRLANPMLRAAALLAVEIAMGETISTSQFRAGRMASVEPLTRAALESILRDEVRHSTLGWEALAAIWLSLTDSVRDALDDEVRRAFVAFENQIAVPALRRLERHEPFELAWAELGVVQPEHRVESFYAAIEGQVLPRLARLGIDGDRAWSGRYRSH